MSQLVIVWIIIFLLIAFFEYITSRFIALCFAPGSLVSLILAMFNINLIIQLIVFAAISAMFLLLLTLIKLSKNKNKIKESLKWN